MNYKRYERKRPWPILWYYPWTVTKELLERRKVCGWRSPGWDPNPVSPRHISGMSTIRQQVRSLGYNEKYSAHCANYKQQIRRLNFSDRKLKEKAANSVF